MNVDRTNHIWTLNLECKGNFSNSSELLWFGVSVEINHGSVEINLAPRVILPSTTPQLFRFVYSIHILSTEQHEGKLKLSHKMYYFIMVHLFPWYTLKRCLLYQFSSVTQSCLTLWDLMNHSSPGLPVHHQLLESTSTHVHWVSDAIQPFHPLSSPSPTLNLSRHQGLFKWVSSSHQVAKVLEFQLQHQS